MIYMLTEIERKILAGDRLNVEEGIYLLYEVDVLDLGEMANEVRFAKNPNQSVTFVVDSNPNYTNICDTDCSFCAFYRKANSPEAYTLSVDQVIQRVAFAASKGATTILLQGGHNPDIPFEYYLTLVRETRRNFPQITPHFFSASEIYAMSQYTSKTTYQVLEALNEAGQYTLPGGGAEILSSRVRQKISPKKCDIQTWLRIHGEAHKLGWRSTATMMFGHIENMNEIVEHLNLIRDLQERTSGFTAFIPWSFKSNNTKLSKHVNKNAGSNQYLRLLAVSRLYLDNFSHIQASWFSEGKKVGQIALHFGADDFGGTLIEENVHAATGHINQTSTQEVIELIKEAEFIPVQRNTLYEILD